VKSPLNAMFEHTNTRTPTVIANRMLLSWLLRTPIAKAGVHFRREFQDTEYLHSVRRDGVLVVNDADVTKP
jgi:hypothetical protein